MAKYTTTEDVVMTKAWISITLDGVVGVDQKSNQFWERVFNAYVSSFGNKNHRTVHKLQNRFGPMEKDVKVFVGILRNMHRNNGSRCNIEDIERTARLEYRRIKGGKPFKHEEVYRLFKDQVPGFNLEEFDPTQNQESESGDPRWYEEDGPRRLSGKRAQQREASEISAINDGIDRILKHFSEENAKKMARLDTQEGYLLTIAETNKKSVDLALEKHELD
ncbi:uncharacterized protein LOC113312456 [Papaver somniferum]|uniref:uncharacterized protein LOC113312456 n=1 Tax=Papaver somniferum TaxID=3469 RepID=UPI000E6F6819|nr:uncharacterized protein LOC113312456 [Papaver somniferum]